MHKILIIGNGKPSLDNIKKSLLKKYELSEARNLRDANRCLKSTRVDLLVIDAAIYPALLGSDRFRKYAAGKPGILLISQAGADGKSYRVDDLDAVTLR